jgi:poly(A) polymerase
MTDRLPPAPWTSRTDLARLIAALGPGNARYVGGAVRDTLLGIEVKDIDLATPLLPAEVMAKLDVAKIGHVPTGLAHGTITAILKGGPVEITTLRHDVSTDGRRATVAFAQEWQEDAARRDFTINALYADPATGEISDFFGGLDDLKAHRVRFIGDAGMRIREDHLRILRYFRFQARFGSQPADTASENACAELAATLKGLSRERIGMEMLNLLALPDPAPTVARMAELGVLGQVLPEADVAALAALVSEEVRQKIAPHALRRLAALLPADPAAAKNVAAQFRLSGAQKKRLMSAADRQISPPHLGGAGGGGASRMPSVDAGVVPPPPTPPPGGGGYGANARALAYRLGMEPALDRLLLTSADTAPLIGWNIPTFPLKGGEIVARGIKAGPEVLRILRAVEDRWVAEGFPGEERVLEMLAEELA